MIKIISSVLLSSLSIYRHLSSYLVSLYFFFSKHKSLVISFISFKDVLYIQGLYSNEKIEAFNKGWKLVVAKNYYIRYTQKYKDGIY